MGIEGIEVLTRPDNPETQDENRNSHIVGPIYTDHGKISGSARVLEAMINGTPIEALCGYTWVPSRNPDNYPLCEACLNISKGRED